MITTILGKVLSELEKEKPDLSYIRGMVEVLLAGEGASSQLDSGQRQVILTPQTTNLAQTAPQFGAVVADPEASQLDMLARANLEKVKAVMTFE